MYFNISDTRAPLSEGKTVCFKNSNVKINIIKYIGCGGFSLVYIAQSDKLSQYYILKELFPRNPENGIAQRRADGKVVIYNPIFGDAFHDNSNAWKTYVDYFTKEKELTEKASKIYDDNNNIIAQNNPDVYGINGPYEDYCGNFYIVIDTKNGESLHSYIDRKMIRDRDGEILFNCAVDKIIDILQNTTRRLSKLHGDSHMYHLDISPDNIYISYTAGGTELTPYIIDYGSAYDYLVNPSELIAHRFTYNPHSAPEIIALADLNDQNCGYSVAPSSDTYSLVSILFYSMTGLIYSSKTFADTSWVDTIREQYPAELFGDSSTKSFREKLITFFEKGLASNQNERYVTTTELFNALADLKIAYMATGALLSQMDSDELISYVVLDKYALYDFMSSDGSINVLCLGSGVFVKRMILSLLSCGQMLDNKLNIHIVSNESEEKFKSELLNSAPYLISYSNIEHGDNEYEYVRFSYEEESDLLCEGSSERIAQNYCYCGYVIISIGSNNANINLSRLYAEALGRQTNRCKNTVINYYMAEDVAVNTRSIRGINNIQPNIELAAFGDSLTDYAQSIRDLGKRALKLDYLYSKLDDSRVSKVKCAEQFSKITLDNPRTLYNQRSSVASALHIKYKLKSLNISPDINSGTELEETIKNYLFIKGKEYGRLLELEHRRWMMYMIADGYTLPNIKEINHYSFINSNNSFKNLMAKKHHCLVPCSTNGVTLSRNRDEWDKFDSSEDLDEEFNDKIERIDNTDYDLLDKMSLKVHLLAGKKKKSPETIGRIKSIIENEIIGELNNIGNSELNKFAQVLIRQINVVLNNSELTEEIIESINELDSRMRESNEYFEGVKHLKNELAVFIEFYKYNDYKAPDATIIENLPWILYSLDSVTMLKMDGRTITDNIVAPLIIEPQTVVYYGSQKNVQIEELFKKHGNNTRVEYDDTRYINVDSVYNKIIEIRKKYNERCIIDVTGANEIYVTAAILIALKDDSVSVIRCTEQGQNVDNIINFPEAKSYCLKTSISAVEVYELYGASAISNDNQYMRNLYKQIDSLWDYYLKNRAQWGMISLFFKIKFQGKSELYLDGVQIPENTSLCEYSHKIDRIIWNKLDLDDIFTSLQDVGFINDYQKAFIQGGTIIINFKHPQKVKRGAIEFIIKDKFNSFFYRISDESPLTTRKIKHDGNTYIIDISSGRQVNADFNEDVIIDNESNKKHNVSKIDKPLIDLQEMGLISDYNYALRSKGTVHIDFIYRNTAIKDCLITAGNILEAYVWKQAKACGYFDDCRSNLSFSWNKERAVKNELDVILTKGLTTMVISCKTAKYSKEHLYEIKYLTDRFSVNSKAVIVYSSDSAAGEGDSMDAIKQRAKAMGIYLVDMLHLDGHTLGDILIQIEKDEYEV